MDDNSSVLSFGGMPSAARKSSRLRAAEASAAWAWWAAACALLACTGLIAAVIVVALLHWNNRYRRTRVVNALDAVTNASVLGANDWIAASLTLTACDANRDIFIVNNAENTTPVYVAVILPDPTTLRLGDEFTIWLPTPTPASTDYVQYWYPFVTGAWSASLNDWSAWVSGWSNASTSVAKLRVVRNRDASSHEHVYAMSGGCNDED